MFVGSTGSTFVQAILSAVKRQAICIVHCIHLTYTPALQVSDVRTFLEEAQ